MCEHYLLPGQSHFIAQIPPLQQLLPHLQHAETFFCCRGFLQRGSLTLSCLLPGQLCLSLSDGSFLHVHELFPSGSRQNQFGWQRIELDLNTKQPLLPQCWLSLLPFAPLCSPPILAHPSWSAASYSEHCCNPGGPAEHQGKPKGLQEWATAVAEERIRDPSP